MTDEERKALTERHPATVEEARAMGWSWHKCQTELNPTHAKKHKARQATLAAIRRGELVRPETCEKCGGPPTDRRGIHAHHDDYDQPLWVRWLCAPCHHDHHKHMNRFQELQRRMRLRGERAA